MPGWQSGNATVSRTVFRKDSQVQILYPAFKLKTFIFKNRISEMGLDLSDLQKITQKFIDDRDWRRFQTTKELAINASVEANELLELFLWDNEENLEKRIRGEDKELLKKIKNETSDVLLSCLAIADQANFDLGEAFLSKMDELTKRYDVKKVKGDPSKIPDKG